MPKNKTKMSESIRRNRAAIACYVITISVISGAYLIEAIKGNRTFTYFFTVLASLWIPGAVVLFLHTTRRCIDVIKYLILFGFALPWAFMLFTANNNLVFTYALVIMIALNAYANRRFAVVTAITYNVFNIL